MHGHSLLGRAGEARELGLLELAASFSVVAAAAQAAAQAGAARTDILLPTSTMVRVRYRWYQQRYTLHSLHFEAWRRRFASIASASRRKLPGKNKDTPSFLRPFTWRDRALAG